MNTYLARKGDPLFVRCTGQSFDDAHSELLTQALNALESINSYGARWDKVILYVAIRDGEDPDSIADYFRQQHYDVIHPSGRVIGIERHVNGSRDEAVEALSGLVAATEPVFSAFSSWAWDLGFDA
jgi:hypothetical protein